MSYIPSISSSFTISLVYPKAHFNKSAVILFSLPVLVMCDGGGGNGGFRRKNVKRRKKNVNQRKTEISKFKGIPVFPAIKNSENSVGFDKKCDVFALVITARGLSLNFGSTWGLCI